jgi:hypothetical protein
MKARLLLLTVSAWLVTLTGHAVTNVPISALPAVTVPAAADAVGLFWWSGSNYVARRITTDDLVNKPATNAANTIAAIHATAATNSLGNVLRTSNSASTQVTNLNTLWLKNSSFTLKRADGTQQASFSANGGNEINNGLAVNGGYISTDTGFVGDGSQLTGINASNRIDYAKQNNLNHFSGWSAFAGKASGTALTPLVILGFGEGGHFPAFGTAMLELEKRVRRVGFYGLADGNQQVFEYAGGAYTAMDAGWYVTHPHIPSGGTVTTTNYLKLGNEQLLCNVFGVSFLATNTAGTFNMSLAYDGSGNFTNFVVFPAIGSTNLDASTNYGAVTRWFTNTSGHRTQVRLTGTSGGTNRILSVNMLNISAWGFVTCSYIQSGGPHWAGMFSTMDLTNVWAPVWKEWNPDLTIYHELVQVTNWVYYLPKFANYWFNVCAFSTNNGLIICNAMPDNGDVAVPNFDTNLVAANLELDWYCRTNAAHNGTNWNFGLFDTYGAYATSAKVAVANGLIPEAFDMNSTAEGHQLFGYALADFIGLGLFAEHGNKNYLQKPLEIIGSLSLLGPNASIKLKARDEQNDFDIIPYANSFSIVAAGTPMITYSNIGGFNQVFAYGRIISELATFGATRTNVISDSGSVLSGVGMTNGTVSGNGAGITNISGMITASNRVELINANQWFYGGSGGMSLVSLGSPGSTPIFSPNCVQITSGSSGLVHIPVPPWVTNLTATAWLQTSIAGNSYWTNTVAATYYITNNRVFLTASNHNNLVASTTAALWTFALTFPETNCISKEIRINFTAATNSATRYLIGPIRCVYN